jgi:hypothetical protein
MLVYIKMYWEIESFQIVREVVELFTSLLVGF